MGVFTFYHLKKYIDKSHKSEDERPRPLWNCPLSHSFISLALCITSNSYAM